MEVEEPAKVICKELFVTEADLDRIFLPLGGKSFVKLNPYERAEKISVYMKYIISTYVPIKLSEIKNELGIIVIKPEAQPLVNLILNILQKQLQIEVIEINNTHYTIDSYSKVYGEYLLQNEYQVGLVFPALLVAGSLGTVTAIAFKHRDISDYLSGNADKNVERNLELAIKLNDPQIVFKHVVVGTGKELRQTTLRYLVKQYIQEWGFGNMDTPIAQSFDITGELRYRSLAENLITFNGIHSPSNKADCRRQLDVFFEPSHIERILKA